MMAPLKQPANATTTSKDRTTARPELSSAVSQPISLSKPTKRTKPTVPVRAITDIPKSTKTSSEEDLLRREAEAQAKKLVEDDETSAKSHDLIENSQPEPSPKTDTAPLGKLATRMKSLLRRNTSEKKKEKKSKPYQEVDRLEDVHWSEM
jgi:hypothetical protein